MSMSFAHVADARVRQTLETAAPSPSDIQNILDKTSEALAEDERNEDIPYRVFAQREDALAKAETAWANQDARQTVDALKLYWAS